MDVRGKSATRQKVNRQMIEWAAVKYFLLPALDIIGTSGIRDGVSVGVAGMSNPKLPGKISAAENAGETQAEHVALARKFISLHAIN
jgi:hypothetical protein